jgi:hypothetical protein
MSAVRVFINGTGIEVAPDSTALAALAVADRAEADAVTAGKRMLTDSRGIAIAAESRVFAGAIFRTVRAKSAEQGPE